jgi:hypothetical protein
MMTSPDWVLRAMGYRIIRKGLLMLLEQSGQIKVIGEAKKAIKLSR